MDAIPALRASGVVKTFGRHRALDAVQLTVAPGTVHGLVGENGAGKSTLGMILSGVIRPNAGRIEVRGEPMVLSSPALALQAGITIMQQELSLAPDLTVAENVLLGRHSSRFGVLSRTASRQDFDALLARTGFEVDGGAVVGRLPLAQQQEVEILRALARDARVIIMDEPTSSLSAQDADRLRGLVLSMRSSGVAVVYISHFLDEVIALSDDITIMRNGRNVKTLPAAEASVETLVTGMLGGAQDANFPELPPVRRDASVVLEVRALRRRGQDAGVDLEVRSGEIVGLFGLVGAGRSEFVHSIFGAGSRGVTGEVRVDGVRVGPSSPRRALAAGIALLPESRKDQGLFLTMKQRENATITHLKRFSARGTIRRRAERRVASHDLTAMGVNPVAPEGEVAVLSGGNQQKVLFAKTLLRRPRILILDEPTRGVDIGARRAIYDVVASSAAAGMAVIIVSSEYEEVANMSHRLLVMRDGHITADLAGEAVTHDSALAAAFGVGEASSHAKELT